MGEESRDPTTIRSLAITGDDVVTAVEARYQRDAQVVLRVTPPFSGRMRARIHVVRSSDDPGETDAVHLDPRSLLADDAPAYPRPGDTEDALRADPGETYSVERHHERHAEAVTRWREAVRDHFVETVVVETSSATHPVDVSILGGR